MKDKKKAKRLTNKERGQIKVMLKRGATLKKIAEKYGVSTNTILWWKKKLGLVKSRKPKRKVVRRKRRMKGKRRVTRRRSKGTSMNFCPHCGESLKGVGLSRINFCPHCGSKCA